MNLSDWRIFKTFLQGGLIMFKLKRDSELYFKLSIKTLAVFGLVLLLAFVFGFTLFNKTTTADSVKHCESCNQNKIAQPNFIPKEPEITQTELEKMRAEIYQQKYHFTIGLNATEYHRYGLNPKYKNETNPTTGKISIIKDLPAQFDWRELNGVTPIRNQGNCGSCWAFATAGIMESAIMIEDQLNIDLSEQYLVSCNTKGWGCNGGWWAHDYHQNPGAVLESCFPYQAIDAICKSDCPYPYKIINWGYVDPDNDIPSVEALKTALYQYGPLAVAVAVDSYFQAYTGGIFDRSYNSSVNHGVVLVGWNDAEQYWIIKNSWGISWGESGYMRIGYNVSKIGYGASYVIYKGILPQPTPSINPSTAPTPTLTPYPTSSVIPSPSPSLNPTPTPSSNPTPSVNPTPNPANNLALNKPVTASSYYSDRLPQYAVDGDLNTSWTSSASREQSLVIDLQAHYLFNKVRINWSNTNYPLKYDVSWWDGEKWVLVATINGDGDWDLINLNNLNTRYLQIKCYQRNRFYYVMYECEVYVN